MKTLRKLFKNDKGATAIEYGLIAALIAVAAIAGMSAIGGSLGNTFNGVSDKLDTSGAAGNSTTP
ncbi:pilus assembly protein Flp/PilA [Sphingobium sp. B2D3A]|uniref:Flp family type IVb pilin n=1 Tax=unclassified Sphingobium TaxID=2611147 RepID=UPI0022249FD3|nr:MULTISPECIES: Flp family type IVb pilin [unclassified Sphingobium]MCW2338044.1 pilus assembly protein Flp/PilA [Sphingobium sp. B2D3A]MCW2384503.1 pilus assembly protein Flp/PilA [Sphingobium sp. B2D3D]